MPNIEIKQFSPKYCSAKEMRIEGHLDGELAIVIQDGIVTHRSLAFNFTLDDYRIHIEVSRQVIDAWDQYLATKASHEGKTLLAQWCEENDLQFLNPDARIHLID